MQTEKQITFLGCGVKTRSKGSDVTKPKLKTLAEKSLSTAELETFIEQMMQKADVTGLSCTIINDRQVVYRKAFGDRNKSIGAKNKEETGFSAASFSKAVFALRSSQSQPLEVGNRHGGYER